MKKYFAMFALLLGVCAANAQTNDTVKYAAGNDLYQGITRKLPYRQMVTPYGVEVTFAKTSPKRCISFSPPPCAMWIWEATTS